MSVRSEVIRIINELLSTGKKISELPAGSAPSGAELIEAVQGGVSVSLTVSQVSTGGVGVLSVVAGTNVTVDNTDPQNPIVSATGSGGSVMAVTGEFVDNTDPTNPVITGIQAALDLKEALYRVFDRKIANYPLVLTDSTKGIEMNLAGANTVTVPLNSSVAFPIGTMIPVVQYGAGLTSIVGEGSPGDVTIHTSAGNLDSPGQYAPMVLRKIAADEWYLWNGTATSGGAGTVTSVGFTGGIISIADPTTTPAFTVAGTSGGVVYFSSASTWASSAALAANALVIGGGSGAAPATTTTGTGVLTALGANVGSAGAFVVQGGILGTPSDNTVWKVGGNTLTVDSVLGGSSGAFGVNIQTNGSTRHAISSVGLHVFTQSAQAASNDFVTFTQSIHTAGVARAFVLTGGAHTGSTASTEHTDMTFDLGATLTKATGDYATNRSIRIIPRVISAGAASIITNAITLEIGAPTVAGSAAFTNAHSIRSTNGWITAQQTATSTQGFRLEQSSNVLTMSFGGANIFRMTSTSAMNIGPTSSGTMTVSSARSILYTSDSNQVSTANVFSSSNTVSTVNATFASFTNSWNTVPAGTNTLIKFIANFTETAAVASTYVNLLIDGTLVFGASPTGAYYGIRVNPTITSLNSITGHGIVVDSASLKSGFGVSVPTAVLQARGANNTVAFLAEDDAGNAIASFGESGGARVIGFFGATPVIRQTMGAATAGGTYTATEQAMLQAVYDAVRNVGIGT